MQVSFRNHLCVSFQGFAESYNDTFDLQLEYGIFIRDSLSKVLICIIELSPNVVADLFYNGEIERNLQQVELLDY